VVERYLFEAGFKCPEYLTTLRQPLGLEKYGSESAVPGFSREAGFCCPKASKAGQSVSRD
jgi:hypothetical protein